MNDRRESVLHTFGMALGVALACSILVTGAVQFFRPLQLAYAALDRNRVILIAAGLLTAGDSASDSDSDRASDRQIASAFRDLEKRLVDLRTGEFSSAFDPMVYDQIVAAQDEQSSMPIPADRDLAKLGRRAHFAPVYLRRDGDRIVRVVLPVRGQGMWSTIRAYVALEPDLKTIASLEILAHQETPGIGDRIEDPVWLARWAGKRTYDAEGVARIRIAVNPGDITGPDAAYAVDAISGATITADALARAVRFWLGPDGFGPFLQRLQDSAEMERGE